MEQYTFFWGGPFSNWYPFINHKIYSKEDLNKVQFTVDEIEFNCGEQFMMYRKAMLFNDFDTAALILEYQHPRDLKQLGRQVKNFDDTLWLEVARDLLAPGLMAKFTQNDDLFETIIKTEGTYLVEAAPNDKRWGIGLSANDPRSKNRSTWQGTNWLGYVLTERVRDPLLFARTK